MPVSSFTCTATSSGSAPVPTASSNRASRAARTPSLWIGPMTRMRGAGSSARSSSASSSVATQSAAAPASSAARATGSAPWP
jgi:hypothetical protein